MAFSMTIRTAEQVAAAAQAEVTQVAREECERRITAIMSAATRDNATAARAAGLMDEADQAMFLTGLTWVAAMRAAWRTMAAEGKDPLDDDSWPDVPAGLVEWLADY